MPSTDKQQIYWKIGLTLQTAIITLGLRGKDADGVVHEVWNFPDCALRRGEGAVILIHG